jgi:endoglucanase
MRILLAILLLAASMPAQQFVRTHGKELVSPEGKPLRLHGTNLGNWLVPEGYMFHFDHGPQSPREIETLVNELIGPEDAQRFWRQYRRNYVTPGDIAFLKSLGFNALRVPFHYKFFVEGNNEGFELLDPLVAWARASGIYLILDMHCAPAGQTGTNIDDSWGYPWLFESPQAQEETVGIWKRMAAHYKDEPAILGYDLLNEPIPHFPQLARYNPMLEPLYRRIVAGIRSVDRNHVVILGGAQWDTNFKVFGKPFDSNMMYTFHKYWTEPTQAVIQEYLDFRDRYSVPIYMGESGENTDEWIQKFTAALDNNQVSWTFWPYKKMDSPRSICSFGRPAHWDEIVAYAQKPRGSGDTEKLLPERPSLEHSREAFNDLLERVKFSKCKPNAGYIQALGSRMP